MGCVTGIGSKKMLPIYFVIILGADIETNPLNRSVEYFLTLHGAKTYASVQKNKGFDVRIYSGQPITN
jgi:hypothetical protein